MHETVRESGNGYDTFEDEELVCRYLENGDVDAFSEIVGRYSEELLRVVRHLIRGKNMAFVDADDIVQDVFMKLVDCLSTFDTKQKLQPWLFRITRNATIDILRRGGRNYSVSLDALRGDLSRFDPPAKNSDPEGDIDMRDALACYLQKLTRAQRRAVRARLEGKDNADIAREYGCSEAVIRYHLSQAHHTLGQIFLQKLDTRL